jgi:putative transposase
MEWKRLLASITGSVDEGLRLRNAYLAAENRILRNQIKTRRVRLTNAERQMLAEMGHTLDQPALASPAHGPTGCPCSLASVGRTAPH